MKAREQGSGIRDQRSEIKTSKLAFLGRYSAKNRSKTGQKRAVLITVSIIGCFSILFSINLLLSRWLPKHTPRGYRGYGVHHSFSNFDAFPEADLSGLGARWMVVRATCAVYASWPLFSLGMASMRMPWERQAIKAQMPS